jgi:putative addiction module component (TIGR02574 family)
MESLMRFWHIKDMSMRPEHRMVAHTGFITGARRLTAKKSRIAKYPRRTPAFPNKINRLLLPLGVIYQRVCQLALSLCADRMDAEVNMSNLAEILKSAMSLDVHDRAKLAERLLASLEELSEEEAERLWADESQRRLEEYRAGRAKTIPAEEVHKKAERLIR